MSHEQKLKCPFCDYTAHRIDQHMKKCHPEEYLLYKDSGGKFFSDDMTSRMNAAKIGKKRPEHADNLRRLWKTEEHREKTVAGIIKVARTDEHREKMRQIVKAHIAENGRRHRVTKLERKCFNILQTCFNSVLREQTLSCRVGGAIRFFDFVLPEEKIIVEIDGLIWHMNEQQIDIDRKKTNFATSIGYSVCRLLESDLCLPKDALIEKVKSNNSLHVLSEREHWIRKNKTNSMSELNAALKNYQGG
jgi:very-short-patch-repair endonuclease